MPPATKASQTPILACPRFQATVDNDFGLPTVLGGYVLTLPFSASVIMPWADKLVGWLEGRLVLYQGILVSLLTTR